MKYSIYRPLLQSFGRNEKPAIQTTPIQESQSEYVPQWILPADAKRSITWTGVPPSCTATAAEWEGRVAMGKYSLDFDTSSPFSFLYVRYTRG